MKKERSFKQAVTAYNKAMTDNQNVEQATKDISEALAFSVLKKVYNASANVNIMRMRASLAKDVTQVNSILCVDEKTSQADKVVLLPFGDGMDIVNESALTLLNEHASGKDIDGSSVNIEKKYTENVLSKHVWIKSEDSKARKDITTSTIQKTYQAGRRYIDRNGSIKVNPKCKYAYIQDVITDKDGKTETGYYRLPRYYQMLDVDIRGKAGMNTTSAFVPNTTTYTYSKAYGIDKDGVYDMAYTLDAKTGKIYIHSDSYTFEECFSTIVEEMNLAPKQAMYLQFAVENSCGYDAIASHFGVSKQTVIESLKAVQKKAVKHGLDILYADLIQDRQVVNRTIPHFVPFGNEYARTKNGMDFKTWIDRQCAFSASLLHTVKAVKQARKEEQADIDRHIELYNIACQVHDVDASIFDKEEKPLTKTPVIKEVDSISPVEVMIKSLENVYRQTHTKTDRQADRTCKVSKAELDSANRFIEQVKADNETAKKKARMESMLNSCKAYTDYQVKKRAFEAKEEKARQAEKADRAVRIARAKEIVNAKIHTYILAERANSGLDLSEEIEFILNRFEKYANR